LEAEITTDIYKGYGFSGNDQIAAKLINAAKKTLGSQIEKLPPSLSSTKELRQRFKERVVHHLMKKTVNCPIINPLKTKRICFI
jgi:mRNA degradation ribonuclease J1/J2